MSEKTDKLWKKDDYLKPVNPNDPMLMYDIEEDEQGNLLKGNEKKSDNLQSKYYRSLLVLLEGYLGFKGS